MKNLNDHGATAMGIATSICTAFALVDFDALDYGSVNTYFKLAVLAIPAIGGYMSKIKSNESTN